MQEATFAGRLLVKDGDFLVECQPGARTTFHSYKIEGAFLCRTLEGKAWRFVEGVRQFGTTVRSVLTEDGPDMDAAAQELAALGVRILSADEARADVDREGVPVLGRP